MLNGNHFPPKDPSAKLDYRFDWAPKANNTGLTNWLEEGETIVSYILTVPDGLTKVSDSLVDDNTAVVVWLSGGSDGIEYPISCQITTANRIDKRTAILPVKNR